MVFNSPLLLMLIRHRRIVSNQTGRRKNDKCEITEDLGKINQGFI